MKTFFITGVAAFTLLGISLRAAADNWVLDFDTNPAGGADFASETTFGNPETFTSGSNYTFQRYLAPNTIPGSSVSVRISGLYEVYAGNAYAGGYGRDSPIGKAPDLEENGFVRSGFNDVESLNSSSTATSKNSSLSSTIASGGPAVSRRGTNVANSGYGNVLFIQEMTLNAYGCALASGGICMKNGNVHADDSASDVILKFDFSEAVDLVGMNIFNIEEGPSSSNNFMAEEWFYYEWGGSSFFDIPIWATPPSPS